MNPARKSLRTKFVFLLTSLIVIVMSLNIVVQINSDRELLYNNLQSKGLIILSTFEFFVKYSKWEDYSRLKEISESIIDRTEIRKINVYDENGKILFTDKNEKNQELKKEKLVLFHEENKIKYYTSELEDVILRKKCVLSNGKTGEIELIITFQNVHERVRQIIFQSILLIAVVLSLGFFMSYFLANFILNPLHKFIDTVKLVAEGDYTRKIHINDDNEISNLAEMFNQMTEKLKDKEDMEIQLRHNEKLAMIGQMSAGLAHEVRNPLVAIRSLSEILADDLKDGDNAEHISVIIREVDRINAFMEQLLDYSKPGNRKIEECNIDEIVVNMIVLAKPQARKKNINIIKKLSHRKNILICRDELSQIILNLILNSIKAIEDDSGKIIIRTSEDSEHVIIEVIDNGRGMTEKEKNEMFTPFFTSGDKGTGLGLTIVKRLIDENGGIIEVESSQKTGTKIVLKFKKA